MIEHLSKGMGGTNGAVLRALLNPKLTDFILGRLGERGAVFAPLLHNTVSPTMLQGSQKINVIPSEVSLGLDGRLVPGAKSEQLVAELHNLLGQDFEVELLDGEPGPDRVDMGMFDTLASVLRELDPAGLPIPYVLAGVTDARHFSHIGIQTYGYTPLCLPDDFNFISTIHAANERVPVEALKFGVDAVYRVLQIFH
jgi:acetylornithine deacetylase/succinyl-diaminopimelate desuccinylase-like protein